jgi:hypothetical protein
MGNTPKAPAASLRRAAFIASETAKWATVIKNAGVTKTEKAQRPG